MPKTPQHPGMDLNELTSALERAGIRGHGGAFFPTATKLRAVAAQRKRPIVVVNGSEGEPLSRKDRFLLGTRPDAVLDGAYAVADALGADTIVLAVDSQRVKTIDAVQTAVATRSRGSATVEVIGVPAGFVTGQETALLSYLGGHEAKPTATPPYPFEKGLRGRPTFVSNVETFAQIGRVIAGTYDGTRYVTVSGAVSKTAVIRVRPDTTVGEVLTATGGVTDHVLAVLLGGYGGTWAAAPEVLELTLDEAALRTRGLTLGAGIVYALGQSECAVAEVSRVTRWMSDQNAGQCGPCVFGLNAIAGALEDLCAPGGSGPTGRTGHAALAQIERWCAMVTGRGGCAHPDGVVRYVSSALAVFRSEFADHAAHGSCERCARTSRQVITGADGSSRRSQPERHGASQAAPASRVMAA